MTPLVVDDLSCAYDKKKPYRPACLFASPFWRDIGLNRSKWRRKEHLIANDGAFNASGEWQGDPCQPGYLANFSA